MLRRLPSERARALRGCAPNLRALASARARRVRCRVGSCGQGTEATVSTQSAPLFLESIFIDQAAFNGRVPPNPRSPFEVATELRDQAPHWKPGPPSQRAGEWGPVTTSIMGASDSIG
jgi:hypothetical protein